MDTSDSLIDAFIADEEKIRDTLIRFFTDNAFRLQELCVDNAVSRTVVAKKFTDEAMAELRRVRLPYGSSL